MSQHWTRLQIRGSPKLTNHSLTEGQEKMPEDIPVEYYNALRDMLPGASYLSSEVEIVNATIDYIQALEHIL